MTTLSEQQIHNCIADLTDVYTGEHFIPSQQIKNCVIKGDKAELSLELGYPSLGAQANLIDQMEAAIKGLGASEVVIHIETEILSHSVQNGLTPLEGVKNTIAIASGKGGVGKSTTAVNLALALQLEGATVGILDADIYGPSQPRMLGTTAKPESEDGKRVEPIISHGLQTMSIGYLIAEDTPMIWRGPMVTSALEQLLKDTLWQDLDYLIIDLPPGTGDIQLTLCQKIPVSGALIVTTPQDIALLDAGRALKMFEKVSVPVLGLIENMSTHVCTQCGHEEAIFGQGGGKKMAARYEIGLLGSLPLAGTIQSDVDKGCPTVVAAAESELAIKYREISRRATAKLALQAKDYSSRFPSIVIQK